MWDQKLEKVTITVLLKGSRANKFWFGCIGLPIGLRSMIHAENQPEWYKQMYNSLHQKQRRHNDYNNRVARKDESNFTNVY